MCCGAVVLWCCGAVVFDCLLFIVYCLLFIVYCLAPPTITVTTQPRSQDARLDQLRPIVFS